MGLIEEHWNAVVRNDWPTKPRTHIRASELGMTFIDRYYSMSGVAPTNPFSERVLRIFDAGKVIEFMVMRALTLSGILNKAQAWLEYPESKTNLRVVGRLDATIGGFVNWDTATSNIKSYLDKYKLDLDGEILEQKAINIITGLRKTYPQGWPEEMMVEVKSISSMAFWNSKGNKDNYGKFIGYPHNRLQLYAYLVMAKMKQGYLLYVSKDDFTLAEVPVHLDDQELMDAFKTDIETMSHYIRNKIEPPKEELIVYNERRDAFEINWNVTRSLYLKLIYGFENDIVLEKYYHKHILDINRALRHLRSGKVKSEDLEHIVAYDMDSLPEIAQGGDFIEAEES